MAENPSSKRPLSPHLQIWRFTPTMAASITHRGTGVALYTGTILLAVWMLTATMGPAVFWRVGSFLTSPFGAIALAGYIWSLVFHLMGGLRYLYFDSGRGLAPKTATMTAWMIYGGSVLVTAIILYAGYAARGGA